MTSAPHLDRRVQRLAARLDEVETSHDDSLYQLSRDVRGLKICTRRLADQTSAIGRGIALMMERMGFSPIEVTAVEMSTEAEIDASFEEEC
ncbi:hypothetical protein ACQP0C_36010 [Nocardia sp. CA-129566]|uniref:hypothetical protein n=1 Tax=Nocardia sp. CA-129566 TaxID=3239976 RepID=UPI003D97CBA5